MKIYEYQAEDGHSPFARWFARQDARAAAKITTALIRMENGNLSNTKGLKAFSNIRSTTALGTEFTLVVMEMF